MPRVAILPVKSFSLGKGRLAGRLADEARSSLGRALAERTAEIAVEAGLIPDDAAALDTLIRDICFENARGYFGLELAK